jgi:hypothetical protein
MKRLSTELVLAVLVVGVSVVAAQDRVARSPSVPNEAQATKLTQAQAAISRAAAADKYVFVFFWREKGTATDTAWDSVQAATTRLADSASLVSIRATDPAEKSLVTRYGVDRAPMPITLAIAPCGAITKAYIGKCDHRQLREAFVSRGTAECMKALQAKKLVLLCVRPKSPPVQQVSLQKGVRDFTADPQYVDNSQVVTLNAGDPAEATFLKDLRVDPKTPVAVTVLMAPPAAVVGAFQGEVTKEQLVDKLTAAQSGCCPGGKCGPSGCCPKK